MNARGRNQPDSHTCWQQDRAQGIFRATQGSRPLEAPGCGPPTRTPTKRGIMALLWAIIAGLVIGLLARLLLPGRQPIPLWATILVGIIGGLIGNGLAAAFG